MTPRQELDDFVETGRLRDVAQEGGLSQEAQDLLVNIVRRYCAPRPIKRKGHAT
jgi:hypothetical protein